MNKKKVSVTPTRKRHQNINTIKRKLQLSGEILEKKQQPSLDAIYKENTGIGRIPPSCQ